METVRVPLRQTIFTPMLCALVGTALVGQMCMAEVSAPRAVEARACVDKGLALGDNSDEEAACYERAIELDPTYANAYFNLAFVYQVQGGKLQSQGKHWDSRAKLKLALETYGKCLKYSPRHRDALFNRASIAEELNRLEPAYAALSRLLDYHPDDEEAASIRSRIRLIERSIADLKDAQSLAPGEVAVADVEACLTRGITRAASPYSGPRLPVRIHFGTDSDRLLPEGQSALDRIAVALRGQRLKEATILLEGHADSRGTCEHNLDLSSRRAHSVKRYLINAKGIDEDRLRTIGYGEDRPLKPNDSLNNMAANRRVEFVNYDTLKAVAQGHKTRSIESRYDQFYVVPDVE